jgi:PAS domain S-box-containing protein
MHRYPPTNMQFQRDESAEEIKRLQRCIDDLPSVLAFSAMWNRGDPSQTVLTFLNALLELMQLDVVYMRLSRSIDGTSIEMAQIPDSRRQALNTQDICEAIRNSLSEDPQKWPQQARIPIGDQDISIVPLRLGLPCDTGFIVAGSRRQDFPGQTESVLLSMASNQVAIGLRAQELVAANKELRREIAERARVEVELRAIESSFRQTIDSIPGLVCTMTSTGDIDQFNRKVLEYFGKTPEELRDWKHTDAVHADDRPRVRAAFAHSITNGTPYDIEHRCRRADGIYRWFQVRALPVRDSDSQITGWYVLFTDIDDRKRAEDAIRESERKLRRSEAFLTAGQQLARIGNFSWRVATDEIVWSEELYRIFDFEANTPISLERIGSRVHPQDMHLMQDMIEGAQRAVPRFEYEHRLLMPDRSVKYLNMKARRTYDKEGQLEYIGAVQDETQGWVSEEALSKARSELARVARITSLGALTASIAHEVNQPLSAIIINADTCLRLLALDPPNLDRARAAARRTIRDGQRASEVITRLSAFFRKKETTTELMDLNEATHEVITLSLSELQRSGVILRAKLAQDLPPVIGDRVQLQQVILNLILNASQAMSGIDDRAKYMMIKTHQNENDEICLSVRDSGVGLSPHQMERIFEPFYTTKPEGMGIGLSVSLSIITSHRGRLWAAQNEGHGATFTFSIPRESCDQRRTAP